MKRKPRFTILIALSVIVLAASPVFIFALDHHITRGDFFEAFGICYGLEGADEPVYIFPDYDGSNRIINEMINLKLLVGRDTGLLDLDDEFTVADVHYFFDDFPWPKETVKEVYIGVPYAVEVPTAVPSATDPHEHLFFLNASGQYECKYCGYVNPPGTDSSVFVSSVAPAKPAEHLATGTNIVGANVSFDAVTSQMIDIDTGAYYYIPVNANLYIDSNLDGIANDNEQVGYLDFFKYISGYGPISNVNYYLDADLYADAIVVQ